MPVPVGEGLVLTQLQSRDTETYGQRNTQDGSSGRLGVLLEISYFTGELQEVIFYNIIPLGLGKTTNSQDRFLAIQEDNISTLDVLLI